MFVPDALQVVVADYSWLAIFNNSNAGMLGGEGLFFAIGRTGLSYSKSTEFVVGLGNEIFKFYCHDLSGSEDCLYVF